MYKRREWKLDTFGNTLKSFTTPQAALEAYKNLSPRDKKTSSVYKKHPVGHNLFVIKNGKRTPAAETLKDF